MEAIEMLHACVDSLSLLVLSTIPLCIFHRQNQAFKVRSSEGTRDSRTLRLYIARWNLNRLVAITNILSAIFYLIGVSST